MNAGSHFPAAWLTTTRQPAALRAWRGVEAQHIVSTMRLVDTLEEQAILETLLDQSKPPLPAGAQGKHYLLFTPFRYRSPFGSRFRRPHQAGVWYGAVEIETVCAEIAYWRWRFLTDSTGLLEDDVVTQHTLFQASVSGLSIDLTSEPWAGLRNAWRDPTSYEGTQALGEAARQAALGWIRYESARHASGICCAVFDVACLDQLDRASQHTWQCKATRSTVLMISERARYSWEFPARAPMLSSSGQRP